MIPLHAYEIIGITFLSFLVGWLGHAVKTWINNKI
jgi:hypothetical protein